MRKGQYRLEGAHDEPHGKGAVELQMQERETGPAQLKSVAAVAKEACSLTQGGSAEKSIGSSSNCGGERAETEAVERRSAKRGGRRRAGMMVNGVAIGRRVGTRERLCREL